MGPLLSYLFSAFWVLPLYWLSKPLNSLWYQVNVISFSDLEEQPIKPGGGGYSLIWAI